MTIGSGVRAEFVLEGKTRALPPLWDENLLRIGQEVLTNSLRHAQASEFQARVSFEAKELRVTLHDNGRGFEPGRKHDGFGLVGIRERVEMMGGKLFIKSRNTSGTTIEVVLPYPKYPAAFEI
jgi:signal transduction histidine kinase